MLKRLLKRRGSVIKIVLDTNVFVSGIFWSGPPYKILDAWQSGKVTIISSAEILDEYIRVAELLAKKYSGVNVKPFIDLVTIHGDLYEPVKLSESVSCDPDDDKFIACALSAKCKTIVSGDSDLLDISGYSGIKVFKPAEFVKQKLIA